MDKLTIMLYLVGFVFLGLATKVWYSAETVPDEERLFLAVDEPFDYKALVASDGFEYYGLPNTVKPGHLLVVYTMPSEECASCLNEVRSFSRLFDEQGFKNRPVQNEIVVVDADRHRAARFVKTADFGQAVVYGYDDTYSQQLQAFGSTVVPRQLLLIEPDEGRVFFRARLAKG